MRIRAAVTPEGAETLSIEALEIEPPRPDELLVRMVATGICHTDLKQLRASSIVPRPVVLGHEGAGVVESVGSAVTEFSAGDHVVMSVNSCGQCRSCARRLPGYCVEVGPRNFGGRRPDGSTSLASLQGERIFSHFFGQSSFASHAICTQRNAVKVRKDVPLERLAPLGCGIQTGAGSVLNAFRLQSGQSIVVFGAGAVGLSAVMAARLAGARAIIAVDRVPERLDLALELGATASLDAEAVDLVGELRRLTSGGADFSLDTTGVPSVIARAVECLGPLGVCGLLATPVGGKEVSAPASHLILGGRSVRGIVQGGSDPKSFIPHMIELHLQGKLPFDRLIREYRFTDINGAIHDAHTGRTIKPVLRY